MHHPYDRSTIAFGQRRIRFLFFTTQFLTRHLLSMHHVVNASVLDGLKYTVKNLKSKVLRSLVA